MLLDKGANVDIRDRGSKTVLDCLREYPAERARKITKMITGKFMVTSGFL